MSEATGAGTRARTGGGQPAAGVGAAWRAARMRWRRRGAGRHAPLPPSAPPGPVAAKAAFLRRVELDVTRRLDGMISGDHLAFASGPGTEPAGARAYSPGDDARRIDWSLTARSLAPHLRTTEADRELETWIVVDRSPSLDFGTAEREKREVALAAVAAFGFLNGRAGNRLGVLVAGGEQLIRLPARSGRTTVLAALSVLYDTPRRERGPDAGADLRAALTQLGQTHRRRGQVVVVSDFLDPTDWATPLWRLALRHQVVAVQVTDPREFDIPAVGLLEVIDAETGARLSVQTNSAGLRQRYATAAAERQDRIRRLIGDAGAERLELATNRDWLVDVARFVRRRRTTGTVSRAPRLAGHDRGANAGGTHAPSTGAGSHSGSHPGYGAGSHSGSHAGFDVGFPARFRAVPGEAGDTAGHGEHPAGSRSGSRFSGGRSR